MANVPFSREKANSRCLSLSQHRLTQIQLLEFRHPCAGETLNAADAELAKGEEPQIWEFDLLDVQVLARLDLNSQLFALQLIHLGVDCLHLFCGPIWVVFISHHLLRWIFYWSSSPLSALESCSASIASLKVKNIFSCIPSDFIDYRLKKIKTIQNCKINHHSIMKRLLLMKIQIQFCKTKARNSQLFTLADDEVVFGLMRYNHRWTAFEPLHPTFLIWSWFPDQTGWEFLWTLAHLFARLTSIR